MRDFDSFADRSLWTTRMLSVLRIVAAVLFIEHGTQKLFGIPHAADAMSVHLVSQAGLAGVLETFGGIALLLGLLTQPVAFVLAGEMAVAYFQVHFPRSVFPVVNRGDNAVLFCFVFLFLAVAGAGEWSFDAIIARRRARSVESPGAGHVANAGEAAATAAG